MIALLDNVQILVISKKLVNKLHSVGFITSLWLGGLLMRLVISLLVVIILCNTVGGESYVWEKFRKLHSTLYTGVKVLRC